MKIAAIETHAEPSVCLVRVRADDGAEGWGQTAPFNADLTAQVLHRQIAPHALGADAAAIGPLVERCIQANYKFPWSYVCRALCGVETALWDLRGRREGRPVHALLGGARREIAVYGSSMRRDIRPAEEAARLARLRDSHGFGAFKVRVGKVRGRDEDQWPGRTEELIGAVRAELGPGVRLLADGNSGFSPRRAVEVGRRLEAHGFDHFEEPCPFEELEQTAEVAAALDLDVAGGEQDNDLAQWRRMARMRAVDVVQPDVGYVGGVGRALAVARLAHDAGLRCVPHCANHSMLLLFTAHLLCAVPNAGSHMEYSIEATRWSDGLYEPRCEVRDGVLRWPEGPGWGVAIPAARLARMDRRESALR